MRVYLASIATNISELDNRVYKKFSPALYYIYNSLKAITSDVIDDGDYYFDREHIRKYFSEDFFNQFSEITCKSGYGEFAIRRIKENKYQYTFVPFTHALNKEQPYDYFIVCEIEILELLD